MKVPFSILVVDDDPVMRESCFETLSRDGCDVILAGSRMEGLELLEAGSYDLVLLDIQDPSGSDLDTLERIRKAQPETNLILLIDQPSVEFATEAMRRGAFDVIPKPFTPNSLRSIAARALERPKPASERAYLRSEVRGAVPIHALIGETPAVQRVKDLVLRAARTDSTVTITGESGTGKELVARALHYHSPRNPHPFVTVDTASLVENLVESELFGHVEGAFTGASNTRQGRFELADGGTLFFDEISNVDVSVQGKLLRAIQEREIVKVGSSEVIKTDVRIVAATNSDLLKECREGRFREDLYYRLSVIPISLPPLRKRREDIPLLVRHFIQKYNRKRLGEAVTGIAPNALQCLNSLDWPGNVRELENVIERAVVLAERPQITVEDLLPYHVDLGQKAEPAETLRLSEMERRHITRVLEHFGGHRGKAAEALGIDRKTLRHKIERYGIRLR